ncbi:MAG: electron transport complex subunit E [Candidatus Omnitrophica bacterium]|nr:electron transport complex subunit E [Candidatus Omnitrophota bacterium]
MTEKIPLYKDLLKGLWRENPVLFQVLGMCPTLAVTTKAVFGLSMGMATSFVLISSSIIVSIFRCLIPNQVRIATYTVIIATFVTIADLFLKASFPDISRSLGPYVPLIVVNCIILGRAEAFASKNNPARALFDAVGMGVGFTLSLILLGTIRELLGYGSIFGYEILKNGFEPWVIMILPPGAFITLGLMVGLFNMINKKSSKKKVC